MESESNPPPAAAVVAAAVGGAVEEATTTAVQGPPDAASTVETLVGPLLPPATEGADSTSEYPSLQEPLEAGEQVDDNGDKAISHEDDRLPAEDDNDDDDPMEHDDEDPTSATEAAASSPTTAAVSASGGTDALQAAAASLEEAPKEPEEQQEQQPEEKEDTPSEQAQQQQLYSTRGRSNDTDPLDRLVREALGDLGRVAVELGGTGTTAAPSALPESFLSDSLTEEERRTRTRYIPQVSGMHMLRKHEIKGDLALARAIHSSTGVPTTLAKSTKRSAAAQKRGSEDNASSNSNSDGDGSNADNAGGEPMDMEDDSNMQPSEDERMSDIVRLGSRTVQIGCSNEILLPSPVFVAPSLEQVTDKTTGATKRSPRQVEAITAFNPPRPPESIGAKKKHRMLRWERRPADIEVDLNNYRKTVQRTQEELRNAQLEQERIETVENMLRMHFLHHIQNVNEEIAVLQEELTQVQQECVNAADLLTSRTRSRVAGKGNNAAVMRDVLQVLRSRGAVIQAKGLSLGGNTNNNIMEPVKGAGGVGIVSFQDWDHGTVIKAKPIAEAWIVPGDHVETPCGSGTVLAFYPPGPLNVKEPPFAAPDGRKQSQSSPSSKSPPQQDGIDATKPRGSEQPATDASSSVLECVLAPRVVVRLPFGIGFFSLGSLKTIEDPSTYTDERLALRWKGLYETAMAVASTLDIEAMSVVGGGKRRLLPFGAEMLPLSTTGGRGSLLLKAGLEELDKALDAPLYDSSGVLGTRDNRSVPAQLSEMEKIREEKLMLQARALQLRNKLYRQRRIRILNERTLAATEERAMRVESLVAEMRSDLKSLKSRLDEEVRELGVSEEQAEQILSSFYRSLDSQHSGEPSPPKRPRRHEMDDVDDAMDEDVEEIGDSPEAVERAKL